MKGTLASNGYDPFALSKQSSKQNKGFTLPVPRAQR